MLVIPPPSRGVKVSKQGLDYERDFKFTLRRIKDDVAYRGFRLSGFCASIQQEASQQELLDSATYEEITGLKW